MAKLIYFANVDLYFVRKITKIIIISDVIREIKLTLAK